MHCQDIESAFSERRKCERRNGYFADYYIAVVGTMIVSYLELIINTSRANQISRVFFKRSDQPNWPDLSNTSYLLFPCFQHFCHLLQLFAHADSIALRAEYHTIEGIGHDEYGHLRGVG